MDQLKIAVWYNNKDIRIEDVARPTPGPREMLVKIISCGICGSDIVEWYRLPRAPLVLGHEIGGEVVEPGELTKKYKSGDRVFIAPKVPCMTCPYCNNGLYPVCSNVKDRMPGGFAEFILPEEVPGFLKKLRVFFLYYIAFRWRQRDGLLPANIFPEGF